ncbi:hypothetical protein MBRA_02539 [Methylobacterium brachiatum]|nr:hypothetical protein MBRA_02539 [Methylobacterium brachiatum]
MQVCSRRAADARVVRVRGVARQAMPVLDEPDGRADRGVGFTRGTEASWDKAQRDVSRETSQSHSNPPPDVRANRSRLAGAGIYAVAGANWTKAPKKAMKPERAPATR